MKVRIKMPEGADFKLADAMKCSNLSSALFLNEGEVEVNSLSTSVVEVLGQSFELKLPRVWCVVEPGTSKEWAERYVKNTSEDIPKTVDAWVVDLQIAFEAGEKKEASRHLPSEKIKEIESAMQEFVDDYENPANIPDRLVSVGEHYCATFKQLLEDKT